MKQIVFMACLSSELYFSHVFMMRLEIKAYSEKQILEVDHNTEKQILEVGHNTEKQILEVDHNIISIKKLKQGLPHTLPQIFNGGFMLFQTFCHFWVCLPFF